MRIARVLSRQAAEHGGDRTATTEGTRRRRCSGQHAWLARGRTAGTLSAGGRTGRAGPRGDAGECRHAAVTNRSPRRIPRPPLPPGNAPASHRTGMTKRHAAIGFMPMQDAVLPTGAPPRHRGGMRFGSGPPHDRHRGPLAFRHQRPPHRGERGKRGQLVPLHRPAGLATLAGLGRQLPQLLERRFHVRETGTPQEADGAGSTQIIDNGHPVLPLPELFLEQEWIWGAAPRTKEPASSKITISRSADPASGPATRTAACDVGQLCHGNDITAGGRAAWSRIHRDRLRIAPDRLPRRAWPRRHAACGGTDTSPPRAEPETVILPYDRRPVVRSGGIPADVRWRRSPPGFRSAGRKRTPSDAGSALFATRWDRSATQAGGTPPPRRHGPGQGPTGYHQGQHRRAWGGNSWQKSMYCNRNACRATSRCISCTIWCLLSPVFWTPLPETARAEPKNHCLYDTEINRCQITITDCLKRYAPSFCCGSRKRAGARRVISGIRP
ncbi:protein of unknown function [Rhodovastum atsumiense]|nr:protein of unknown function [Rhodovastum atsumiense]